MNTTKSTKKPKTVSIGQQWRNGFGDLFSVIDINGDVAKLHPLGWASADRFVKAAVMLEMYELVKS